MQNPNPQKPGNGFKEWLSKNPWVGIIIIILLVIIIYQLCKKPPTGGIPPGLTFNPLNGGVIADSLGNRDGQINPGERVNIRVRLFNTGKELIPAFTLALSTQDSGVTFIDNRVAFDAIAPGDSALSKDSFEFQMPDRFVPHCVVFLGAVQNVVRAEFIAEAFAQNGVSALVLSYASAPNYRVCVGACTLRINGETADELTIELKLCNGSATGGPTLSNPTVEIDNLTLRACKPFVAADPIEPITPVQNNLQYSTIGPGTCTDPSSTTIRTFRFNVPPSWEASVTGDDICVRFDANIYSNPPRTLQATAYVGIKATLLSSDLNRPTLPARREK